MGIGLVVGPSLVVSLTYIFQVLYVLCFFLDKISGELLQDHWSSGITCTSNILFVLQAKAFTLNVWRSQLGFDGKESVLMKNLGPLPVRVCK